MCRRSIRAFRYCLMICLNCLHVLSDTTLLCVWSVCLSSLSVSDGFPETITHWCRSDVDVCPYAASTWSYTVIYFFSFPHHSCFYSKRLSTEWPFMCWCAVMSLILAQQLQAKCASLQLIVSFMRVIFILKIRNSQSCYLMLHLLLLVILGDSLLGARISISDKMARLGCLLNSIFTWAILLILCAISLVLVGPLPEHRWSISQNQCILYHHIQSGTWPQVIYHSCFQFWINIWVIVPFCPKPKHFSFPDNISVAR